MLLGYTLCCIEGLQEFLWSHAACFSKFFLCFPGWATLGLLLGHILPAGLYLKRPALNQSQSSWAALGIKWIDGGLAKQLRPDRRIEEEC